MAYRHAHPWIYCAAVRGCCLARDFVAPGPGTGRWPGGSTYEKSGGAYLGNRRIYRSRLMFLNGAWPDALDEIAAVCTDLDGYTGWVCGHAYYQLGEVRRLRASGMPPKTPTAARRNRDARHSRDSPSSDSPKVTSTPRQPASVGR